MRILPSRRWPSSIRSPAHSESTRRLISVEWSGFAVRVTYAFVQIIAIGAEVTAVAIYFSTWFPAVPQWIWVVAVSIGLIAINAMRAGNFAEFEYWFAIIKVIAIVAFILVGLGLIFGLGPVAAIGFSNLTSHGGLFPQRPQESGSP